MVSPDSQGTACPLSGRNSTYRPVQISGTSSDLNHINDVLEEMCFDPYQGDVKFLRGSGGALRRRVGDWRILFELDRKNN
jgi:hypothetical protein